MREGLVLFSLAQIAVSVVAIAWVFAEPEPRVPEATLKHTVDFASGWTGYHYPHWVICEKDGVTVEGPDLRCGHLPDDTDLTLVLRNIHQRR